MIPKPRIVAAGAVYIDAYGTPYLEKNTGVYATQAGRLEALDASVMLTIDGASSLATIRLPQGVMVDARTYIEMFTIQGSAGVFRVRSPQTGYGDQSTQLQLEHAINELGDFIVTDKIEKKTTLKKALKEIFDNYYSKKSNLWKLGDVDEPKDPDEDTDGSEECVLEADYDNCLDVINGIMEQYPYMMLSFDFSKSPWRLNVLNRPTTVQAEGRLSRNVKSATVTRDDSELFTKIYMVGYNKNVDANGYGSVTSKYWSGRYGVIETVITGANDTKEIAERTIKNYLRNHKKPKYSISVNATELSDITGEKLDSFRIGKRFRLALPDYGETVEECVTGVVFQSVYQNPNAVTVRLSDEEDKVIKYIKDANKKASSVGKKAVTKMKVKGNTLTLTQGDGTTINFSKAVTMIGEWKGGRYTVKAYHKPDENSPELGEYILQVSTKLNDIVLQANKLPTVYDSYWLSIPLKVMYDSGKIGKEQGYGNTEYTQDFKISAKDVWDAVTVNPPTCRQSPVSDGDTRTAVPIKATAVNGNSNEATFNITRSTYTVSGSQNYCVNLLEGSKIIGRIGVQSVYEAGWNAVTVGVPTGRDSAVPSGDTRTGVVIKATASNNASNEATFTLTRTTYVTSGSTNYCVNLLEGSKIIGRIGVQTVYNDGWNAVTVNPPTCAQSAVGANTTRSSIRIKATASNSASNESTFTLTRTTYGDSGNHCVNLLEGSTVIGRIGTQAVFEDGGEITSLSAPATSGGTSTHNPFTVTATSAGGGSKSVSYYVTFSTVGTQKYAEIHQGSQSGTLVGRATVI